MPRSILQGVKDLVVTKVYSLSQSLSISLSENKAEIFKYFLFHINTSQCFFKGKCMNSLTKNLNWKMIERHRGKDTTGEIEREQEWVRKRFEKL